jgi:hypothetical protein
VRAALRAAQAHAPRAALAAAAIAAPVRGCADLCLSDHRLVGRLLGALAHGHHGHGCGERRVEGARVGLAARGREGSLRVGGWRLPALAAGSGCGSGAAALGAEGRGGRRGRAWLSRGSGCFKSGGWLSNDRLDSICRMNRKISAIQGKRSRSPKMHHKLCAPRCFRAAWAAGRDRVARDDAGPDRRAAR